MLIKRTKPNPEEQYSALKYILKPFVIEMIKVYDGVWLHNVYFAMIYNMRLCQFLDAVACDGTT